jgi:hypothetical protein
LSFQIKPMIIPSWLKSTMATRDQGDQGGQGGEGGAGGAGQREGQ